MESKFSYKISQQERSNMIKLFIKNDLVSIDQHPDWVGLISSKTICYYQLFKNNKLVAYAIILERFRFAHLSFGPVAQSIDVITEALKDIHENYKRKNFGMLSIQLGVYNPNESKKIKTELSKSVSFIQKNNSENWSTMKLNLEEEEETILSNFSSNHKRSIKKAIKTGFYVKEIFEEEEIDKLSNIYVELYRHRKIITNLNDPKEAFAGILNLFKRQNAGFVIGVYNENNEMVGGVVVVFQGDTAFYYFGAASPKFRKHPILHLAFYEAFKISKKALMKCFDLGGYNRYAKEGSQVSGINRFKDGFKGEIVDYSEKIIIKPNRLMYFILSIGKEIYPYFQKLRVLFKSNKSVVC
jgi:hypothetical protein